MVVYMTSSPTGNYRSSEPKNYPGLNPVNGLVEELKKDWKDESRCILISASPDAFEINEENREYFHRILLETGLSVSEFVLCDHRNYLTEMERICEYDFILLGGGHVPTQLRFFEEMKLRERLCGYEGIVMGISAGSMDCARIVYAQPEEPGEALDPSYEKFPKGLALTETNILPHYQAVKDDWLDGFRLFEEITYSDSFGKKFYILVDGSYILKRGDQEVLCGEGYLLKNGIFRKICEEGQRIAIS